MMAYVPDAAVVTGPVPGTRVLFYISQVVSGIPLLEPSSLPAKALQ